MIMLAIPMWLLFEVGLLLGKMLEKSPLKSSGFFVFKLTQNCKKYVTYAPYNHENVINT